MKKYTHSVIILFICMLILAPSTVYAEELVDLPVFSIVEAASGAALSSENFTESLAERLEYYIDNSFSDGKVDAQKYDDILSSGMISEEAFFENSVFVGDSLTVGFEKYCKLNDSIASDSTYFLARVSCSAKAAISNDALTKHSGIMPMYNGKVQYIEDSVAQLPNVTKMFICFGMNDLTGSTPEEFVSDLQVLIGQVLSKTPDLQVYVISIPCIMANVKSGGLSNKNIKITNDLLRELCIEKNWGFINISDYLMGQDGAIRPEYSSDKYVHENNKAYTIWNNVLKDYAFMELAN